MIRLPDRVTTAFLFRLGAYAAFWAFIAAPQARADAADAPSAETLRYTLSCSLDEGRASLDCTADIWIRILRDSLESVAFRLPASSSVHAVTDGTEAKVRRRIVERDAGAAGPRMVCTIPGTSGVNDSLFFRIRYTITVDTSAASDLFVSEREFVLQCTPHASWVPLLDDKRPLSAQRRAAPVVIEINAPSSFIVLSGGEVDSLSSRDGRTAWRITRTDVRGIDESFCVAGSSLVTVRSVPPAPGVCGVTLCTPPSSFNAQFAEAVMASASRASQYFASQKYRPRFRRITFASVGAASVDAEPLVSGSFVLVRTGPEHALFDSTVLRSSAHNSWLLETARAYAFDAPDSSYWFNESWTGYCATRFLFASSDTSLSLQMEERSHILSHALDFFPARPIAAGRTDGMNEDAVFTYKGRYVFMMLEYVMGREAFDDVITRLYADVGSAPPSIRRFQRMCEEAYGSTLAWFFDEWLYRTGFPEFVLTSKTELTPRGAYDVTVNVVQRGELFTMPLNVHVVMNARSFLKRIFVTQQEQRFTFMLPSAPVKIEWNPQYLVLRWVPHFRILAHARTSASYRVFAHDLAASEREARLTLQLDPDNSIGANALALYSLGKAAGARADWAGAETVFLEASKQHASGELSFYPLLSAVRHANLLDQAGRHEEARGEYAKALEAAERDPLRLGKVIVEARRFLARPFQASDARWYDAY